MPMPSRPVSLERRLVNHDHVHRCLVIEDAEGWEVREEDDATVVRRTHHSDWHRVEWDVRLFEARNGEGH